MNGLKEILAWNMISSIYLYQDSTLYYCAAFPRIC